MKCKVCGADHALETRYGVVCDACWAKTMRAEAADKPEPYKTLILATVAALEQHNRDHPYPESDK